MVILKGSYALVNIVKASGAFPKKPDTTCSRLGVKSKPTILPAFVNPRTGIPKQVYCIMVDGAREEDPSHHKVQFLWTEQHLESGSYATLVTCQNSGASYLTDYTQD